MSFSQALPSLKIEAHLQGAVGLNLTGMNTAHEVFLQLYSFQLVANNVYLYVVVLLCSTRSHFGIDCSMDPYVYL